MNEPSLDESFQDFNSLYLVSSMRTVLAMIEKHGTFLREWRQDRAAQLEDVAREIGWGDEPEWIYDIVNDETTLDIEALRTLYASLAVIIASGAERVVTSICSHFGLALPPRPTWGEKKNAVEARIKCSFESMPGFSENRRARVLGNCFKHSDGFATTDVAIVTGVGEGEEIEFERESWKAMIEGTDQFLEFLCKKVATIR